jgi:hypothetical protein
MDPIRSEESISHVAAVRRVYCCTWYTHEASVCSLAFGPMPSPLNFGARTFLSALIDELNQVKSWLMPKEDKNVRAPK